MTSYFFQTDEQAPLPGALAQLLSRVRSGIAEAGDFIFNCQMGRGRTTTGMITACLISSTMNWTSSLNEEFIEEISPEVYDPIDGPSEEEVYLAGEDRYPKAFHVSLTYFMSTQGSIRLYCSLLVCFPMAKLRSA